MWAHLGPLLVWAVSVVVSAGALALFAWVVPLVIMTDEGRRSPYVREHAVESLNFQISQAIYCLVALVPILVIGFVTLGVGFLLVIPLALGWLVWAFVMMARASSAASAGDSYRYPITIQFVR
jgi:uncharacterized Tic20 family protein